MPFEKAFSGCGVHYRQWTSSGDTHTADQSRRGHSAVTCSLCQRPLSKTTVTAAHSTVAGRHFSSGSGQYDQRKLGSPGKLPPLTSCRGNKLARSLTSALISRYPSFHSPIIVTVTVIPMQSSVMASGEALRRALYALSSCANATGRKYFWFVGRSRYG